MPYFFLFFEKWIKDEQQNDHQQIRFHFCFVQNTTNLEYFGIHWENGNQFYFKNHSNDLNHPTKTISKSIQTILVCYSSQNGISVIFGSQNIYSTSIHLSTPLTDFHKRRDATWNVDSFKMFSVVIFFSFPLLFRPMWAPLAMLFFVDEGQFYKLHMPDVHRLFHV